MFNEFNFSPRKDELAVIRAVGDKVSVSLIKSEGPVWFGKRPFRKVFLLINRIYDYFFFRGVSRHSAKLKVSLSKGVVDRIILDDANSVRLKKIGEISKG